METLVKNANDNINSIKTLLDAQQKKLSIVSYEQLADKSGYVLLMSDGSKITLKNGQNGESPIINVKQDIDGNYYWTLNGEFMTDANGNKIKAEGKDGANGITPKLRVNSEGYWEVSMDEGKTWKTILDEDGNPVQAVGSDATVDLTITEDEDSITIVYDGKTFVIPKNGTTPDPKPIDRPFLSIDYVPEYNVAQDGKSFASSNASDASGYFNWDDAMALFARDKYFTIDGHEYHLPSFEEWIGIIPEWNAGKNISFSSPAEVFDFQEMISIAGAPVAEYKSDYKSLGDNISYGLRFKDASNNYLSAWRYALVKNSTEGLRLEITVRYLGPEQNTITIDNISNPEWWNSNKSEDIFRALPCSGIQRNGTSVTGLNEYGDYWLSKEANESTAWNMYIYSGGAFSGYSYSGKNFGFTIRLISDQPISENQTNPKPTERPMLPIDYVAEYDINKSGDAFTQDHNTNLVGLYTWAEAKSIFSSEFLKDYHLPSKEEWLGIFSEQAFPTRFDFTSSYDDVQETIEIAGTTNTYFADYRSTNSGVAYAIKLKSDDNQLLSAYKYEVLNLASGSENGHLKVTVRFLGPDSSETIENVASEKWWSNNCENDIIRIFPASGRIVSGSISNLGRRGYYWSSTEKDDSNCWMAHFDDSGVDVNFYNITNGRSVRPFKNK